MDPNSDTKFATRSLLAALDESQELQTYQALLSTDSDRSDDAIAISASALEEFKTAPLIWWDVKQHLSEPQPNVESTAPEQSTTRSTLTNSKTSLQQYAVLGHVPKENAVNTASKPVLLNTNSPWSAFLCGSQGSGKSHALSCMLENCLLQNDSIGKNPHPLAGLVFHYDSHQGSGVCEAAYLCSSVPTTVLVSESNFGRLKVDYEAMAARHQGEISVRKMKLLSSHLDTERVKTLMAIGKDGELPLYMHILIKILRDMAKANGGIGAFDYKQFKRMLDEQGFSDKQNSPLNMRLALLESFIDTAKRAGPDFLVGNPGTLTIIDLTDPVVDADSACVLFDICLSIFISQTACGKIVALDEAHNYMTEESSAAKQFTNRLLKTIREQRHQATRVVVATQEPTINTALLDLCSVTMVHRCTSPAWFAVLKKHIAGMFLNGNSMSSEGSGGEEGDEIGKKGKVDKELFQQIVQLKLGESLLFCPTAAVAVDGNEIVRMVDRYVKFKTRERVTADGGTTKLAGDA
ncbi:hypothetical protein K505DRAFT_381501 [Melanomma pulvis-pyrius CBS 109.77]|uniref:AAA+ ATPase domain-containing protein n=1 Tax=Melanomma pulvis-pyrius CBS 109.77 TaxID=1314802 RepID=A0A6A6XK81_9PLEO|nr:hypothetical protein K505DRAFT_381501 [Melanomma pulvis-pyrius CBS 109.77]